MMKNMIAVVLLIGTTLMANAQNKSIRFEDNKNWKEVVRQAKKEKKLIFMDCYTSWCGPCKYLAMNVFTKDSVADVFNGRFVNVKYDMEKSADGPALAKQYGVKAYPTLLFVDPATGEAVHKMVGGGNASWLIYGAALAGTPDRNLTAMVRRYKSGERGAEFLKEYLPVLTSAYMVEEVKNVAGEYLDVLTVEELATKENWELVKKYVKDPLSASLRMVMANRERFYALAGRGEVDNKLSQAISRAVDELVSWRPGGKKAFDEQRNAAMIAYLQEIDFDAAPAGLAGLYAAAYARRGEYRNMLDKMDDAYSYNLFRGKDGIPYFRNCMRALMQCPDTGLVREGIRRTDEMCKHSTNSFDRVNLATTKKLLYNSIGDTAGVAQAEAELKKYRAAFRAERARGE